jgi:hypothetical protein
MASFHRKQKSYTNSIFDYKYTNIWLMAMTILFIPSMVIIIKYYPWPVKYIWRYFPYPDWYPMVIYAYWGTPSRLATRGAVLWLHSGGCQRPGESGEFDVFWRNSPPKFLVKTWWNSMNIWRFWYFWCEKLPCVWHFLGMLASCYPLVNCPITIENHHYSWGFIHYFNGHFQ